MRKRIRALEKYFHLTEMGLEDIGCSQKRSEEAPEIGPVCVNRCLSRKALVRERILLLFISTSEPLWGHSLWKWLHPPSAQRGGLWGGRVIIYRIPGHRSGRVLPAEASEPKRAVVSCRLGWETILVSLTLLFLCPPPPPPLENPVNLQQPFVPMFL